METVSVIPPSGGTVVAVAAKVAVDDPASTFTEGGTASAKLLAETDTAAPPAGAGADRVSVQVEDAPASRVVASQANAEIIRAATRLRLADWEAPFRAAVMVAGWVVVMAPAVAMKVTELATAGTVTDAGIVSRALLSDSMMVAPERAA